MTDTNVKKKRNNTIYFFVLFVAAVVVVDLCKIGHSFTEFCSMERNSNEKAIVLLVSPLA